MTGNHELARSAGLIGGLTLLSRVAGMVRDMVVANFFGAGMVADAFYVAFSIPNMLRRLVGEGSLTVAFVPVFTEYLDSHSREEALRVARIAFTIVTLILLVITLLGILGSRYVVLILAPGFRDIPGKIELATRLTQEMFPYLFFIGLVALAMGVLNSLKHFTAPAFAPVLLNLAIISAVLTLHHRFAQPGLSLALGVLLGGILQLGLQLPVLWKHGISFRPEFAFAHPAIVKVGRLLLPSVIGIAVYQINMLVATVFVSPFPGGRTFIFYADRLTEFPLGVFAIAIGTAILPTLSGHAAKKDFPALTDSLGFGLRLTAFIILPATVGLALLRVPLIELIYERGQFSHQDTLATAEALLFFTLALPPWAGIRVLVPAYYAMQDARTPVRAAAAAMVANALGCWLLVKHFAYAGVALSVALAAILNFLLHFLFLDKRLARFLDRPFLIALAKSALACLPMAALAWWIARLPLWHQPGQVLLKVLWLGAAVLPGALLYLAGAWLLRSQELAAVMEILRQKRQRRQS
jgi:putative peptidoglycan lipid II flippase